MTQPRLNLVVLRCRDLPTAVRFYEAIGLRFERERHGGGPEHYTSEADGGVFELYPMPVDDPDAAPTTNTRVGFAVADVDAAVAAADKAGATVLTNPAASRWGRRAVLLDPDGHRVELTQGN